MTAPFLFGDCNQDGVVNFDDIPAFISVLLGDSFLAEADINQDGVVDFDDVPLFVETLLNWPGLFAMFQ